MKKTMIVLAATLGGIAIAIAAGNLTSSSARVQDNASKVQPKDVILDKDSQSDKYGEVAFNHDTHSLKNYNPEGTAPVACTECHHTDQPASALKPPLKLSERDDVLTTASLAKADAKPVKRCRACHLQAGDDSYPTPVVTYPGKSSPTKLLNDVANHNNCNVCHDKAIAARPALKGKIPGANDCLNCHKPIT